MDIFDKFERTYCEGDSTYFLVLKGGRKRKSKIKDRYFEALRPDTGEPYWTNNPVFGVALTPYDNVYKKVRDWLRTENEVIVRCKLVPVRDVKYFKNKNKTIQPLIKPVRKEKWWDRIKVWFSRKFWIPLGK